MKEMGKMNWKKNLRIVISTNKHISKTRVGINVGRDHISPQLSSQSSACISSHCLMCNGTFNGATGDSSQQKISLSTFISSHLIAPPLLSFFSLCSLCAIVFMLVGMAGWGAERQAVRMGKSKKRNGKTDLKFLLLEISLVYPPLL